MFQTIDVEKGLKKLNNNIYNIAIVDWPYNIGINFGNSKDNMPIHEYLEWVKRVSNLLLEKTTDDATIFFYGFSEILSLIAYEVCYRNNLDYRFLIWTYKNKNTPSNKTSWQRSHESILWIRKSKNSIFNVDKLREPYTETFLKNSAGKIRKGTIGRFSKIGKETTYIANQLGALPRDVISFPALAGGAGLKERLFFNTNTNKIYLQKEIPQEEERTALIQHPTQKPMALTMKLLNSCIQPSNNNILIPFLGSGSEAIVAKSFNEVDEVTGFDLNPNFVKMTKVGVKTFTFKDGKLLRKKSS